jgi:hypothetical protein
MKGLLRDSEEQSHIHQTQTKIAEEDGLLIIKLIYLIAIHSEIFITSEGKMLMETKPWSFRTDVRLPMAIRIKFVYTLLASRYC